VDAVGSGCLWLSHHRSLHQLLSTRVRAAARSTACVLYICRCQPPQREGLPDTHTHTHTHSHGRPLHNRLGLMLLQWRRIDSAKGRGWHVMSTLSPQPKSNSVHFRFKTRPGGNSFKDFPKIVQTREITTETEKSFVVGGRERAQCCSTNSISSRLDRALAACCYRRRTLRGLSVCVSLLAC